MKYSRRTTRESPQTLWQVVAAARRTLLVDLTQPGRADALYAALLLRLNMATIIPCPRSPPAGRADRHPVDPDPGEFLVAGEASDHRPHAAARALMRGAGDQSTGVPSAG